MLCTQEHTERRHSYSWQSYQDVYKRCRNFAAGLSGLGLQPGDKVGIMSVNRAEWAITDFTCMMFGFVAVTLYDTFGADVIEYIINHADVKAVVVSQNMVRSTHLLPEPSHATDRLRQLPQVSKCRSKCPSLKYVVLMDDLPIDRAFKGSGFTHRLSQIERCRYLEPLFLRRLTGYCAQRGIVKAIICRGAH